MPITIKKLPHSQIQFEVKVDEKEMQKWRDIACLEISNEIKIPGFRKGHVPYDVLKLHVGEKTILTKTIELAIPVSYSRVVKKENLQVISKPEVKIKKEKPFIYEVIVAVMPDIKLNNYKKIKIPPKKIKVSDKDRNKTINRLRKRFALYKEVPRKAKEGDRLEIDFIGKTKENIPLDKLQSKNHPLLLGSKSFVPGFEENLVGTKAGDKKEFEIIFPSSYYEKSIAGKKVMFFVDIKKVEEVILPEIDADFIKKVTGKDLSINDFNNEIEKNLQIQVNNQIEEERQTKLFEELDKIILIDLPPQLLKEEINKMLEDMKKKVKSQGIPFEKYLEHIKKDEKTLKKDLEEQAKKRLRIRFAIQEIIKKEDIKADEEDFQKIREKYSIKEIPKEFVRRIKLKKVFDLFLN